MSENDGFIGRWSRRKRAQDSAPPEDAPAPPPDPVAPPAHPDAPATLSEDELAALPRIEDLTEGSDISAFLRAGVPRALQNAARRQVWMATPAIRDYRDPAVDYAWDWNTPGGVPGDGFAPSPERAARMLRDLFAPRAPTTSTDPESPGVAVADTAPPASAPDGATLADDPTRVPGDDTAMAMSGDRTNGALADNDRTSPMASGGAASGGTPTRTARTSDPSPVRRRHGGALPG